MLEFFKVPQALAATVTGKTAETAGNDTAVSAFVNYLWNHLDNWIAAVLVVIFSVYLAKIAKKIAVDKVSNRLGEEHEDVLILVGRATYVTVLLIGLTAGLKMAGIDLTTIIAAVGFGIGFALKDLIMNFLAGVMVLASRQFTIGDFIKVGAVIGKVEAIQSRATILRALDGTKVIVPNADLFTSQVTSFTSNPFRRVEIAVGVEYRTNLSLAVKTCFNVLDQHRKVLKEPKPSVILDEFGESSINLRVRFWVESRSNWLQTKSEVIKEIKAAFDQVGINIPFPIRTLVFDRDTESAVVKTKQVSDQEYEKMLAERIEADQKAKGEASNLKEMPAATGDYELTPAAQAPQGGQENIAGAAPGPAPVAAAITPEGQQINIPLTSAPAPEISQPTTPEIQKE